MAVNALTAVKKNNLPLRTENLTKVTAKCTNILTAQNIVKGFKNSGEFVDCGEKNNSSKHCHFYSNSLQKILHKTCPNSSERVDSGEKKIHCLK